MNIIIRNIEPAAIKKIDELAEKKKMSRNEYLKEQIEMLSIIPELKEMNDRYYNLVDKMCDALEKNNNILAKYFGNT